MRAVCTRAKRTRVHACVRARIGQQQDDSYDSAEPKTPPGDGNLVRPGDKRDRLIGN